MKRMRVRLPMVTTGGGGGVRHLREVWVEMRRRALQIKTEFKTIIVHYFATLFKETLSR